MTLELGRASPCEAGLLYADDVCLMANSEEDIKVMVEKVNECVVNMA